MREFSDLLPFFYNTVCRRLVLEEKVPVPPARTPIRFAKIEDPFFFPLWPLRRTE